MNEDEIVSAAISAGGVGPTPLYLSTASEFLKNKSLSEEIVFELIQIAKDKISPISDARGSKKYFAKNSCADWHSNKEPDTGRDSNKYCC